MAGLTCPECYKQAKPYGSPQPMLSGFTDQVVVCQCGVGGSEEYSGE